MLLWDGTARVPLAVLSDGPIGHKRQFCDTKTPSRILSSEKGRLYPQLLPATAPFWPRCAGLATLRPTATAPTFGEPYALTPLRETLS